MDLSQKKLTREEWEAIEQPLSAKEKQILTLIKDGYDNVNIKMNNALSLLSFMKINKDRDQFHNYFYNTYFKKKIDNLVKKYDFAPPMEETKKKKVHIKKADKIRIENSNKKLQSIKNTIYEFILLSVLEKLAKKKKPIYYYTLHQLMKNSIEYLNIYVCKFINNILSDLMHGIKKKHFIKNAYKYMERNDILNNLQDLQLYSHQKQLFTYCKSKSPKLILYQAPTGTGKTISPIGLSQGHKVIFVCAAKHVGLQLAKSCIAVGLPIAIAFGCSDASDIRLHYYAVKDFVKNRRTGGIFRVDNSSGEKVQLIISDIQSYLPAMYYMLAFNSKEDIIWYWDEPTITLDYDAHDYHDILKKNWEKNMIPNIILSSATLPLQGEIMPCIQHYRSKFRECVVHTITSYECKKSIPIINNDGEYVLPHLHYERYEDIRESVEHLIKYKTILRHFNLQSIIDFILYVNKKKYIKERFYIDNYFESIMDINVSALKEYYLEMLRNVGENYNEIFIHFHECSKRVFDSSILITTSDAYTLTDGPTIFIVNDVDKVGDFCLKTSQIPNNLLNNILENLKINDKIYKQIKSLKQQMEMAQEKEEEILARDLADLYGQIKAIELDKMYIPNSFSHLRRWDKDDINNAFTCNLTERDVEMIVSLNIEDNWKILLLMGIGVFKEFSCVKYREIMKRLAEEQRLYLIIASSDYIYGTNYQFCHGYLGKDLKNITQEKIIQACGRIGRSNVSLNYSIRLRDDGVIDKLLKSTEHKPEVINMNRLFGV